jgi:mono/diheme cytochrome c family protein
MPSRPYLTDKEVHTLVEFVRAINRLGLVERLSKELAEEGDEMTLEEIEEIVEERVAPGDPITVVRPGAAFRANTEAGRALYMARCASCHGPTGRGDGLDLPVDEQGKPIKVRDLTSGRFRGGFTIEEIFKRVRCGIPGTPMPMQEGMTNEEIWQIVYYMRFLSGRRR